MKWEDSHRKYQSVLDGDEKGGHTMHEKDRRKILKAGLTLYRCSEIEKVIKVRSVEHSGWKIKARLKSKAAVQRASKKLYADPKAIQV